MKGWGYYENGFNQTVSACLEDGNWNVTTVSPCMSKLFNSFHCKPDSYETYFHLIVSELPCPDQPPPVPEGPGALRLYNPENTRYISFNGRRLKKNNFKFKAHTAFINIIDQSYSHHLLENLYRIAYWTLHYHLKNENM